MTRIVRWLLSKLTGSNVDAVTLFGRTYWLRDVAKQDDDGRFMRLLRHELKHQEQQARLGWRFYPLYAWEHLRHGYRGNKFEVEAREAEHE